VGIVSESDGSEVTGADATVAVAPLELFEFCDPHELKNAEAQIAKIHAVWL
jgi:hypothetical protein